LSLAERKESKLEFGRSPNLSLVGRKESKLEFGRSPNLSLVGRKESKLEFGRSPNDAKVFLSKNLAVSKLRFGNALKSVQTQ
jgi:hypothetical protein